MIGWKDEKQDEIQIYAQPINAPSRQMEPTSACCELLSPKLRAQVSAEQRVTPRWGGRQKTEGELKGSLSCGYFLKRLSL